MHLPLFVFYSWGCSNSLDWLLILFSNVKVLTFSMSCFVAAARCSKQGLHSAIPAGATATGSARSGRQQRWQGRAIGSAKAKVSAAAEATGKPVGASVKWAADGFSGISASMEASATGYHCDLAVRYHDKSGRPQ